MSDREKMVIINLIADIQMRKQQVSLYAEGIKDPLYTDCALAYEKIIKALSDLLEE